MATKIHHGTSLNPFVDGVYIIRPKQFSDYFSQHTFLQIPPANILYFWMKEQTSSEWSKNTTPDLKKALRVFNEYLKPIGKSCALVCMFDENIKIEALDDGFTLSTSVHGFKVILNDPR